MVSELLSEAFEVDGRIVRSLKLLLFKPGQLTAEFSADRRASYVSPIRLYLFSSLLFFFVLSVFSDIAPGSVAQDLEVDVDSRESVSRERVDAIEAQLDARTVIALEEVLAREGAVTREIVIGMMDPNRDAETDESQPQMSAAQIVMFSAVVNTFADPARFFNDLVENAPLATFVLLPAYALLLKLVYIRKRVFYVEHLVFALHLHSLVFLIYSVLIVLPELGDVLESAIVGSMGLYYWLALKRYYRSGWFATTIVFLGLSFAYLLLMIPATLALMALTVAMS